MAGEIPTRAEELLTSEPLIAHLATCHDNRPHVAPLWFTLHEGRIEITTTGRKLANIRENPRVSLSVQKDECGTAQWGVSIRGMASITTGEEADAVFTRLNNKYGATDEAWRDENTAVTISIGSIEYWEY